MTDRPDQTESSALVPVGSLQVESGVTLERDQGTGRLEGPGTLLRYGVSRRLELRLAWPGRLRGGFGDPAPGAKLALADDLALIGHVSLPVGDEDVGSTRADPAVRLTAAHDLAEGIAFGWNLGWEAATDGGHTLARWVYTAALGFDLSDSWGTFVELFGDLSASAPGPAAHSLDAGVTYLLTPRLQLDLAAGVALSDAAPDRFVGAGLSLRFPR